MGEVIELEKRFNQEGERSNRAAEVAEQIASLAILTPALAAEVSNSAVQVGAKLVKKILKPQPPEIPWYTPYDTREELKSMGLSNQEIGRRERFKRKSKSNLEQLTKIGG